MYLVDGTLKHFEVVSDSFQIALSFNGHCTDIISL